VVTSRIEHVRRRSGKEGAAGLLRRGVLRDSDRLAISLETSTLGLRGYRLRVAGSPPPRDQFLHGVHDRIVGEETAGARITSRSLERKYTRESVRIRGLVVEPHLRDPPIVDAVNRKLVSIRSLSVPVGPPANSDC
jgi:hypothetical protein